MLVYRFPLGAFAPILLFCLTLAGVGGTPPCGRYFCRRMETGNQVERRENMNTMSNNLEVLITERDKTRQKLDALEYAIDVLRKYERKAQRNASIAPVTQAEPMVLSGGELKPVKKHGGIREE